MNTLSWIIYGIDVVSSLKDCLVTALFLGTMASAGSAIGWLICAGVATQTGEADISAVRWRDAWKLLFKRAIYFPVLALLPVILIPSDQTMKLIVASEVGERLAQNATVQEFTNEGLDYMRNWLKSQKLEKKKEKSE